MTRSGWRRYIGSLLALLMLSGCAANQPESAGSGEEAAGRRLTGMVNSRERTVLPRGVLIRVELLDVSGKDGPPRTIAMQEIEPDGRQLPIPFDIPYRTSIIDPERAYILRVKIFQGRLILFANTSTYSVITNGVRSNIEVIVEPFQSSGGIPR